MRGRQYAYGVKAVDVVLVIVVQVAADQVDTIVPPDGLNGDR